MSDSYSYKTKQVHVDATQWTGKISEYPWQPMWFTGAMDHTDNDTHGKIVRVGDKLQVSTANGTSMAEINDWIVYWLTTKALEVVKPEDFQKRFERDERKNDRRIQSWRDRNSPKATIRK